MNLYLIVFLLLAAASVLEWLRPQHEKKLYLLCWSSMTALLCLRFGQGTDYVTYHAIYESIPAVIDLSKGYICGYYPEIGWRLLTALFKTFHAPFWVFPMALGAFQMLLLNRFLGKYVPMKVTGLFLTYPVLFIVYMVSGMRQGLAICLFLGIALPFYLERRWFPYVVSVLIAASFHKVGYAWLVLIAAAYLPVQAVMILAGLSIVGGLILQVGSVQQMIIDVFPPYPVKQHVKQFLLDGQISLFAVAERLVSFAALTALYLHEWKNSDRTMQETVQIMKAYICGVCFYMLLSGSAYYASRYGAIFKVLECVLIVHLIRKTGLPAGPCQKAGKLAAVFFFGLTLVMGIKNLNAAVHEGGYDKQGINILTYPYISVFDQDRIYDYYDYSKRLDTMYTYTVVDQELWMIGE